MRGRGREGASQAVLDAQRQQQGSAAQDKPASQDSPSEKKSFGPDDYEAECKKRQQPTEADLCQQWRMANAAENQLKIIAAQYDLQVLEVRLLIGTLVASLVAVFVALFVAMRQLRAYVWVTSMEMIPKGGNEAGFVVMITVENSGQTPAYDLSQWALIAIREKPLKDGLPPISAVSPGRGILGPKGKTVPVPRFTRPITDDERRQIIDGSKAIYVYGEIRYRDVFRKKRITKFRTQCSEFGFQLGSFKPCDEGNEAS